MQRSLAEFDSR